MDLLPVEPSVVTGPATRSALERWGLSRWDALGLLAAVLFMVAFAPPLMFESWTPRAALLLAVGPLGLLALSRLVRSRDRAAIALSIALLWTVVTALTSSAWRSATLGFVGRDLSALIVVLSAGLWAVGRLMTPRGRRLLPDAVLWSTGLSALVGIAQVIGDVRTGPLALASGRPTGLVTNPVYFGAICAAGMAIGVSSWKQRGWRRSVVPIVLLGVGSTLSGSRAALLASVAVLVTIPIVHRSRTTMTAVLVAGGALAGGVLLDRVAGAGRNAADRLTAESGGGRLQLWRYGLDAWTERWISGYGFGRFRPAVQDKFSVDFVRESAPDEISQAWFDAHNIGIGLLVAVGLVGTILFVVWAVTAALPIRGPLAWALVPIAVHWLLQPVSLFTLPLAMLAVGAASTLPTPTVRGSRYGPAACGVVGLVFGSALFVGDLSIRRAADNLDGDRAAAVAELFGRDPIVADLVAQIYAAQSDDEQGRLAVLEWRRYAAQVEPDRPFWWSMLARHQIGLEQFDDAEVSLDRALELQRNNIRTLRAGILLAVRTGDEEQLRTLIGESCGYEIPECELDAATLLEQVEDRAATVVTDD